MYKKNIWQKNVQNINWKQKNFEEKVKKKNCKKKNQNWIKRKKLGKAKYFGNKILEEKNMNKISKTNRLINTPEWKKKLESKSSTQKLES